MFKVWDRVRPLQGCYEGYKDGSPYNIPREGGVVHSSGYGYLYLEHGPQKIISPPLNPNSFELITHSNTYKSSIKERVVKEIMAGEYGHVIIESVSKERVFYRIDRIIRGATAQDLRHAALVFNELADVLEENSK